MSGDSSIGQHLHKSLVQKTATTSVTQRMYEDAFKTALNDEPQDWVTSVLTNGKDHKNEMIQTLDLDKDGAVSKDEFKSGSENKEISEQFREFSKLMVDNYGMVTELDSKGFTEDARREFRDLYQTRLKEERVWAEASRYVRLNYLHFDQDGDGKLERDELLYDPQKLRNGTEEIAARYMLNALDSRSAHNNSSVFSRNDESFSIEDLTNPNFKTNAGKWAQEKHISDKVKSDYDWVTPVATGLAGVGSFFAFGNPLPGIVIGAFVGKVCVDQSARSYSHSHFNALNGGGLNNFYDKSQGKLFGPHKFSFDLQDFQRTIDENSRKMENAFKGNEPNQDSGTYEMGFRDPRTSYQRSPIWKIYDTPQRQLRNRLREQNADSKGTNR